MGKNADKKITTIYVRKDITDFCKEYKINLSEWVNEEFSNKFLSINSKTVRLEEIHKESEKLNEEIRNMRVRLAETKQTLTRRETQYITQVPYKLRKGFELVAIKTFFNNEYHREFSLDEFRALVDLHRDEGQRRLELAMSKAKKKRVK